MSEPPAVDSAIYTWPDVQQTTLFDPRMESLDPGLTPVLVWFIDKHDLLNHFRAVIVDNLEELKRSPMVVCASTEVPPLASLKSLTGAATASTPKDDFEDWVKSRRQRREDESGEVPPQL